jgi:hypothetical protein
MMGEEHYIEDLSREGYRLLGRIHHVPVRSTVRTWKLAVLEKTDGFLNLV